MNPQNRIWKWILLLCPALPAAARRILKHRKPQIGFKACIFAVVITLGILAFVERIHHAPTLPSHLKDQSLWLIIAIAIIVVVGRMAFLLSSGLIGPRSKVAAKWVQIGLGRAMMATHGIPDRNQRLEAFVRRLRKINTSHAPEDLQQALAAYIAAFEQVANELRTKDSVDLPPNMKDKEQQLQGIIRKYLV